MYRIGIDLGGTNIATGVVDANHDIVGRANLKTNVTGNPDEVVASMVKTVHLAIADAGISIQEVESIGVGSPGTVDSTRGVVEEACHLDFYGVPLAQLLSEKLGKSVYVMNDANAAALGEYVAGAGRGADFFVTVTLGTGIGSGVIINGQVFEGCNFAGAELGHICIAMDGQACKCGNYGCWEVYASATALIEQTKKAMLDNMSSRMWNLCDKELESVTGKTVFDAAQLGDETAKNVLDNYYRYVAIGIANVIECFQPDIICIGGGISNQKATLLEPIKKIIDDRYAKRRLNKKTEIKIAELGNDAGIIGAANIVDTMKQGK